MTSWFTNCWFILIACAAPAHVRAADPPAIRFEARDGEVRITAGGQPLARYVYNDETITRPYFCDLCAPGGIQVTRNHPPNQEDLQDHATFHPGLWLAFGDINGHDYWRLKAKVVHDGFAERPQAATSSGEAGSSRELRTDRGGFVVRNRYVATDGKSTICEETCKVQFLVVPEGHWILWDSTITSPDHELRFGDQEEMGLGVRLATSLAVQSNKGGRILNSDGRRNEQEVWGRQALWCDYSGPLDSKRAEGKYVGAVIFAHPDNPRPCWWHVRDYGLLVANGFGERSVEKGKLASLVIPRGESLRLRYGVLLHASQKPDDADLDKAKLDKAKLVKAYKAYAQLAR